MLYGEGLEKLEILNKAWGGEPLAGMVVVFSY